MSAKKKINQISLSIPFISRNRAGLLAQQCQIEWCIIQQTTISQKKKKKKILNTLLKATINPTFGDYLILKQLKELKEEKVIAAVNRNEETQGPTMHFLFCFTRQSFLK